MWQVLLAAAAAAAGSGYFAKHVLQPSDISQENGQKSDQIEQPQSSNPQESAQIIDSGDNNVEVGILGFDQDSIFRFCSDSGSRSGSKKLKKKVGGRGKEMWGNVGKVDVKCGRRFAVCLKKRRRTGKNACAKCEFCASKGNSSFGWGVGMGIMYMMSTGKVEISKLNTAVDETAKVVQELKTELAKRMSSRNLSGASSTPRGTTVNQRKTQRNKQLITEHGDGTESYGLYVGDEGDCISSVLTDEEPQLELLEIAQLEAELESELLKLPGTTSCYRRDEEISSSYKIGVAEDFSNFEDFNLELSQSKGVLASELDQKLSHLLIQQQESHIVELESKLQTTNSKLSEKEAELQALKDCVKRLTEFSIANASDEDIEAQADEEKTSDDMECDSRKSAIGIKRAMDFEPYGFCTY